MTATVTEGLTVAHMDAVYSDPYITRVGHDSRPCAPVRHDLVRYLSAWVDGEFSGAFMAVQFSAIEIEVHALLHRKAIKHSRDLGFAFLAWAFGQPIQRVTAHVTQGLETARNYCLRLGFKIEGRRRDACLKNGKLVDVYLLGITRRDWQWAL